jgi:hypothetical protein
LPWLQCIIYGNPYDLWPTDHVQNSVDDQVSQQNEECSLIEPAKPGHWLCTLGETNMQIHCKPAGLEDQDLIVIYGVRVQ